MPKVQKDVNLHQEVQQFVISEGGVSQAAMRLGVDRTTLWRFHRSGCAIDRTRHALSLAIKRNKSETTEFVTPKAGTKLNAPISLSSNDLKTIRSFCQSMMALVDLYEQMAEKFPGRDVPEHVSASAKAVGTENSIVSSGRA